MLQKVKAIGYTGVSFYVDWNLLEGTPGTFRAEGVFDLNPFFEAAAGVGIYLLARPGPYINAEVSGGGFPGWLQRIPGHLRTNDTSYLEATNLYMQEIGRIIADAQITNGGPVILVQPENEYTNGDGEVVFPNGEYFAYVEKQLRDAGIVVPLISNDQSPQGIFAPGNGTGSVDIYGHDAYPLGFDCTNPYWWRDESFPTNFRTLHEQQSPTTPYSLVEFQGGSFDPWGGPGFAKCLSLVNEQFERIFYKNDISFGVTIFNQYMIFGGTNWGNLGHPGGYTSYDYGAVIAEDLSVSREKYSEAKLIANSLKASPAYLTATPGNASNSSFSDNPNIAVTPIYGNGTDTNFYVVRHAAYNSNDSTSYKMQVETTQGSLIIPQLDKLSSTLTLSGRDSKIHVTDFNASDTMLLYSTGEVFAHLSDTSGTTIVLFGGENEVHELGITLARGTCDIASVSGMNDTAAGAFYNQMSDSGKYNIFQWRVIPEGICVTCSGDAGLLTLYLLWRNEVYNWWPLELEAPAPVGNYASPSKRRVLIRGGYLLRSAAIRDDNLFLTGDINATTTFEVIAGAPDISSIYFNGEQINDIDTSQSRPQFTIPYEPPDIQLPTLSTLNWTSIDGLPELSPTYDDSLWTNCNHTTSNNPLALTTNTSVYASDYGFHTGTLLYRGHFTTPPSSPDSASLNLTLSLQTQGGYAYAYTVFLNSTHIYSFPGVSTSENQDQSIPLPNLASGSTYTLTIIVDSMGLNQNGVVGADEMKRPRGILSYNLTESTESESNSQRTTFPLTFKLTGNLGGESYRDLTRGPLNEGGTYPERLGLHLPNAPTGPTSLGGNGDYDDYPSTEQWWDATPFETITSVGLKFFTASFTLPPSVSSGYAIPLGIEFANTSAPSDETRPGNHRVTLFVNGYQMGKYVNNVGPQRSFPVPEGILDYGSAGRNKIALIVWCFEEGGCTLGDEGVKIVVTGDVVLSGRGRVGLAPGVGEDWVVREDAY